MMFRLPHGDQHSLIFLFSSCLWICPSVRLFNCSGKDVFMHLLSIWISRVAFLFIVFALFSFILSSILLGWSFFLIDLQTPLVYRGPSSFCAVDIAVVSLGLLFIFHLAYNMLQPTGTSHLCAVQSAHLFLYGSDSFPRGTLSCC